MPAKEWHLQPHIFYITIWLLTSNAFVQCLRKKSYYMLISVSSMPRSIVLFLPFYLQLFVVPNLAGNCHHIAKSSNKILNDQLVSLLDLCKLVFVGFGIYNYLKNEKCINIEVSNNYNFSTNENSGVKSLLNN